MYEYGDNLSSSDLIAAFRETFRCAAQHVKEGMLMNAAIVLALKDARDEWKVISSKNTINGASIVPRTSVTYSSNNGGARSTGARTSGKSPARAPPPDKPATVKGFCGPFNRREGCSHGPNCRNGEHKCTICRQPGHGASSVAFHPPNAPGTKRAREDAAGTSGANPTTPSASRMRDTAMRTGN